MPWPCRFHVGDMINIKQQTYRVTGVSFAVDHTDDVVLARVRQNVELERERGRTR